MQVYSSAIVERTVLRASRSFIGARLPPLFLHLPLEQTLEIDDCTEFALGQLLYERRAGKPHARSLPKNAREWAQEQPELCALRVEFDGVANYVIYKAQGDATHHEHAARRFVLGSSQRLAGAECDAGDTECLVQRLVDAIKAASSSPVGCGGSDVLVAQDSLLPVAAQVERFAATAGLSSAREATLMNTAYALTRRRVPSAELGVRALTSADQAWDLVEQSRALPLWLTNRTDVDSEVRAAAAGLPSAHRSMAKDTHEVPTECVALNPTRLQRFGLNLRDAAIPAAIHQSMITHVDASGEESGAYLLNSGCCGIAGLRDMYAKAGAMASLPASAASAVPLTPTRGSCAVVGSSGILQGSELGRAIDNADMVIRFNHAPTTGYERDVGSRTDVRFVAVTYEECDILRLLAEKMPTETESVLVTHMHDTLILGHVSSGALGPTVRIPAAFEGRLRVLPVSTLNFMLRKWMNFFGDDPSRPASEGGLLSKGLTGVLWALQHCRTVDAYGFGFDNDAPRWYYDAKAACPAERAGRERMENVHISSTVTSEFEAHDLVFEEQLLADLDAFGVIRLHTKRKAG